MYAQLQSFQQQAAHPQPTTTTTPSAAAAATATILPSNPVVTFTEYYHGWVRRVQQQQQYMQQLATPQQRAVAQSHLQWMEYHRDNASRAANFYHSHPSSSSSSSVLLLPTDFALPPNPLEWQPEHQNNNVQSGNNPAMMSQQQGYYNTNTNTAMSQQHGYYNTNTNTAMSQNYDPGSAHASYPLQQQPQQQQSHVSSSNNYNNDAFKRYFDRCMRTCQTPTQKLIMKQALERKVKPLLEQGTYQNMQWDSEPVLMIAVGGGVVSQQPLQQQQPPQYTQQQHVNTLSQSFVSQQPSASSSNNNMYYGPATTVTAPFNPLSSSSHSYYESSLFPVSSSQSDSSNQYYGPSATTTLQPQQQQPSRFRLQHSQAKQTKNKRTNHAAELPSSDSPSNKNSMEGGDTAHGDSGYYGPASSSSVVVGRPPSKKKQKKQPQQQQKSSSDDPLLEHRAKRFSGPGGIQDAAATASTVESGFDKYMGKGVIGGVPSSYYYDHNNNKQMISKELDYEQMKVKGTCQVLEKDYLRLTAPPRPELVRPLSILKQHLNNLQLERANKSTTTTRREYDWFCSQLKAIRQDCTVQHIQNAFTVNVYETHARIALEEGDLNEYNQCQTQLKELYRQLSKQEATDDDSIKGDALINQSEFTAYRLLYYIFLSCNSKYDGGSSDLFQIMDSLTQDERNHDAVAHALNVRVAVADADYHAFFCLYKDAPNLGRLLMDYIVPSMRKAGLHRLHKAYRPSVEVDFVVNELGFDGIDFGSKWLQSCGCVLSEDGTIWSTKDTELRDSDMEEKKSLI